MTSKLDDGLDNYVMKSQIVGSQRKRKCRHDWSEDGVTLYCGKCGLDEATIRKAEEESHDKQAR